MSNFIELKEFKNALRYLKKQGIEFPEGSKERKNLKILYETLKEGYAVGVLRSMCPFCNEVSDNGQFMCVKTDAEEYKQWQDGDVPKMICGKCLQLSKILVGLYGFDDKDLTEIFNLVKKIKSAKGQ